MDYPELQTAKVATQKELEVFIDRLGTQNSRLHEIESRLGGLRGRLDGSDSPEGQRQPENPAAGLMDCFDSALSVNMSHINNIDDLVQRLEQLA